MWRGGLGTAYLLPALSSAGSSIASPCFRFRTRFNPASHKRLILIATITLLGAAINRWPFEIILREPILINLIDDAFLLPLIAYDLWSMRKVHRATIWGGLFLIVMQQLELPIGSTAIWQGFATWVLKEGRAIHLL
jgi:hypothetical protein